MLNDGAEEILSVDLYYNHKKLVRVIGRYNPNFNNIVYIKKYFSVLQSIILNKYQILLMGDFNIPNASMFSNEHSNKIQYILFKDFVDTIRPITQCENFPTRGSNILDLIFVRLSEELIELKYFRQF